MKTSEIRKRYLDFFKSKNHDVLESASLIPQNDPSLLLIGAGMAPFKDYFTGKLKRENPRVSTCQKCIRTGDIDNVGKTARHHTFFEMLGNFSFGDYFKEDAIKWAWEFLTENLGLNPENLWVSVYEEDQEAYDLWRDLIKIPEEKIVRLGKKDNFWEVGVGPCGPCSEIYVDQGEKFGCGKADCKPGCDCDRFLEVWNLVFTQFDKDEEGNYHPLASKNIDTGMGLERIAAVMQGVDNNFEIDIIFPIIQRMEEITGKKYGEKEEVDVSLKVIADHIRAVVFMVADGVLPGNEGRGYVLRRLLRRAVRHGLLLGLKEMFMYKLVDVVIQLMEDQYPELKTKRDYIVKVVTLEEEKFAQTLEQGMQLLEYELAKLTKGQVFPGDIAFKLYDTYGFPLDLTKEVIGEKGFELDEEGYKIELEAQRRRAREARGEVEAMGTQEVITLEDLEKSNFIGYTNISNKDKIAAVLKNNLKVEKAEPGEEVFLVTENSVFYPQGGGQLGDKGIVTTPTGSFQVTDTQKKGSYILLKGKVTNGTISVGQTAEFSVDKDYRENIRKNHTATHILHKVLREVLGSHVEQAGSEVGPDRFRFDFTHFGPLTKEELAIIQQKVNEIIEKALPVTTEEMDLETARKKGAMALFGEKYEKQVRVVAVGEYSLELCGGTHVKNTSEIRYFKILSEGGIGSGLRRIEGVTGNKAFEILEGYQRTVEELAGLFKCQLGDVVEKAEGLMEKIKEQEKEINNLLQKLAKSVKDEILETKKVIGETEVFVKKVNVANVDILRELADSVVENRKNALVVLGAVTGDKVNFVAKATGEAVKNGIHCGKIIKEVAQVAGGGGGGRPDMAQAGGKNIDKIDEALEKVYYILE
ncbi:alanyl-tRNA synthetase [Anaerobranca californiensis DSM 14826]|jgi:alanyl-tRNA synthetase|uniref:Alanine--tRNA ligase n=1 Tax=Anaerobranca californiensis DSM 14826 TaxID=1120989 RepID=A0A1M6LDG3_9FIRM|nr:alanine--tRNA ligase [Anaerobranca californiensis]SHJ69244.1 alanyl-tRNA synthetase [Anaerobranca californiensis DSM 14826]